MPVPTDDAEDFLILDDDASDSPGGPVGPGGTRSGGAVGPGGTRSSGAVGPGGTRSSGEPPPWKILVVDDAPDIRTITRAGLRTTRHDGRALSILEADSGREARAQVEAHPDVAVILLDVVMEHPAAGLDFARWLEARPLAPRPRVILRTGQPGQRSAEDAREGLTLHAYLEKTDVTVDTLRAVVLDALDAHAAGLTPT